MFDKIFPKIHTEGYKFIIISVFLTILFYFISTFLGLIFLILTVWVYYFFRDPERISINDERFLVSPADGLVVDVSDYFLKKMESVKCFKSQFYNPKSDEPESFISSKEFLEFITSRSIEMGHKIGVNHGEGFVLRQPIKINNISTII